MLLKVRDVVHKNSQLVTRRKVGGRKSVVEKYVMMWKISGCWCAQLRINIVYLAFF